MSSFNYQIGSVPLRPGTVDREFLKSAKSAVSESKVRRGQKAVIEILDTWKKTGELSPADFQLYSDYTSNVGSYYKTLQKSWWDARKEKNEKAQNALQAKMAVEGQVLEQAKSIQHELRHAGAKAAVQALGGSLSGPAGILAAYAAYTNSMNWTPSEIEKTRLVLEEMKALESGSSAMITENNDVKPVHHKKIWKEMNDLLDKAIEQGKAGNPTEVDLQYYELTSHEMVEKIADVAKAGNKVRLNLDAGRLTFPTKDSEGDYYFNLDATPDKLRTIIQLSSIPDADVAVSLFPQKELLGSPNHLMHRKVMRVGEEVLVGGMNANLGSGENVDSGYVVKGSGAVRLSRNLARDIQNSKGADLEDIWGSAHIEKFSGSSVKLGPRGFIALLDCLSGPEPVGTNPPEIKTYEQLEALAEKAGVKLSSLVTEKPSEVEAAFTKMMSGRGHLTLSNKGKSLLKSQIERAIKLTGGEENQARLDDMALPTGKTGGAARVDVADSSTEREALVLNTIAQAEKFVYLPTFVLTQAVAAALVARRDQLAEQGKNLDIRVLVDSSIYPHGGTPNSYGVKHLEDHGIQPRWSKLERSGNHDRKIHAKHMITDRGEITGSTNFSVKGLRSNWETSVFVHADTEDPQAVAARDESVKQFEELWDKGYELDSTDYAVLLNRGTPAEKSSYIIDQNRDNAITQILYRLNNYERETGKFHQTLLHQNEAINVRFHELQKEGYSYGDSLLQAAEDVLGKKQHAQLLTGLSSDRSLRELAENVRAYKNGEDPKYTDILIENIPEEVETFFA